MGDRSNLPTRKPFTRDDNGYMVCPVCEHTHRHAPANARPDAAGQHFLRALVTPETKQWLIDTSRAEGISISALTRRIFLWYRSQREQAKATLPETQEKHWTANDE